MMTLYHGWRSSASRRVRLALAEKGLDFESRIIDMVKGEQHSPEYLALNPNGVVPALVHDGRVLYESSFIVEYLDEVFPAPPLMPADAFARHNVRNFVRWIDEHCLPKIIVFNWSISMQPVAAQWSAEQLAERLQRVPSASRREAWTRVASKPYTDEEKAEAMRGLLQLPARMDTMLREGGGPWLCGERYTLADIAAVPFIMRIDELRPGACAEWPAVQRWWDAARARPSFTTARIESYVDSVTQEHSAGATPA